MFLHLSVSHSFGGWWYPSMPCRWYPSMPCIRGWYPAMPCRPTPGGVSRPTPRGGLQVHTQGVSRPTTRGSPGPHLGGSPGPHLGGPPGPHLGGVSQHALRQTPPMDGYCRGQYASYWNAFLLRFTLGAKKTEL